MCRHGLCFYYLFLCKNTMSKLYDSHNFGSESSGVLCTCMQSHYNAYGGQQFPAYYAIGSPGVYFGCYPVSSLHGRSSPITNSKFIETSLGSLPNTTTSTTNSASLSSNATGLAPELMLFLVLVLMKKFLTFNSLFLLMQPQ